MIDVGTAVEKAVGTLPMMKLRRSTGMMEVTMKSPSTTAEVMIGVTSWMTAPASTRMMTSMLVRATMRMTSRRILCPSTFLTMTRRLRPILTRGVGSMSSSLPEAIFLSLLYPTQVLAISHPVWHLQALNRCPWWKARRVALEKVRVEENQKEKEVAPPTAILVDLANNLILVDVLQLHWRLASGVARLDTCQPSVRFPDRPPIHLQRDLQPRSLWNLWLLVWRLGWSYSRTSMDMSGSTALCWILVLQLFSVAMDRWGAIFSTLVNWAIPWTRLSSWSVAVPFTLVVMQHHWALGLWSSRCSSTSRLGGFRLTWWREKPPCCWADLSWSPLDFWWTSMANRSSSRTVTGKVLLEDVMVSTCCLSPAIFNLANLWTSWTSTWWFLMMMWPRQTRRSLTQSSKWKKLPLRPLTFHSKYLLLALVIDLYDGINYGLWKFLSKLLRKPSMPSWLPTFAHWLGNAPSGRSTVVVLPEPLRWPRSMACRWNALVLTMVGTLMIQSIDVNYCVGYVMNNLMRCCLHPVANFGPRCRTWPPENLINKTPFMSCDYGTTMCIWTLWGPSIFTR